MRITRLVLKGYDRIKLRSIEKIEYFPLSKIQLLIGTNGSGKSSLLYELTPLPSLAANYSSGGYKEIDIEHKNSFYKLRSDFTGNGNKYTFVKDDVELNTGGTLTTYKELVKQEFGITEDIHALMIGAITFTSMSTKERREWFTRLSQCDYTYALSYYDRISRRHRDIVGAIKLNNEKLLEETAKCLTLEDKEKLHEEIDELNEVINRLVRELPDVTEVSKMSMDDRYKALESALEAHTKAANRLIAIVADNPTIGLYEDCQRAINHLNSQIAFGKGKTSAMTETLQGLECKINVLKDNNIQSLADTKAKKRQLEDIIIDLQSRLTTEVHVDNPKSAITSISDMIPELTTLLVEFPPNPDKAINRDSVQTLTEQKLRLTNEMAAILKERDRLALLGKEYVRLKEQPEVTCPKCTYSWLIGYSQSAHDKVVADLIAIDEVHDKVESQIKQTDEDLEKAKHYFELMRNFRYFTSSNQDIAPVWAYISSQNWIFTQPMRIVNWLQQYIQDLHILSKIEDTRRELKSLNELAILSDEASASDLSSLEKQFANLQLNLAETQSYIRGLERSVSEIVKYLKVLDDIEAVKPKLQSAYEDIHSHMFEHLKEARYDAIRDILNDLHLKLNQRVVQLRRSDEQDAVVQRLKENIEVMTNDARLLKIAVKELSPKEGLIARSLLGFINLFLHKANSFIRKVWKYPLEILPLSIAEGEVDLDYKFKLKVGEHSKPVDDVSKGSSAIKEVIDLSFKIVTMQYLGLQDYPLYLDELGHSMDHAHREAIFGVISDLFTSADFEQIYVVSHFVSNYGSLVDTDVNVLCDANVQLPSHLKYNQQMRIS